MSEVVPVIEKDHNDTRANWKRINETGGAIEVQFLQELHV